jgi:hypothetical protein
MSMRSNLACYRCGGPSVHAGVCTDGNGEVYPDYEALAIAWAEEGRPALTPEEAIDFQESVRLSSDDEQAKR